MLFLLLFPNSLSANRTPLLLLPTDTRREGEGGDSVYLQKNFRLSFSPHVHDRQHCEEFLPLLVFVGMTEWFLDTNNFNDHQERPFILPPTEPAWLIGS